MANTKLRGVQSCGKNNDFYSKYDVEGNEITSTYVTKSELATQKAYVDTFGKQIEMSLEDDGDYDKVIATLKDLNGNELSSSFIKLPKVITTHTSTFHFSGTSGKVTSVEGEALTAFDSSTQELDQNILMTVYPFSEIKFEQVQLQDSSGNDLDGKDDFIFFPNCYMKTSVDEDEQGWNITFASTKIDDTYSRAIEDDTRPYLGLGCYKASTVGSYLRSVAGNYPTVSMSNESADSKLPYYNGKKIESEDWRIRMSLVNNLVVCFLGDRNTQDKFMGVVSASSLGESEKSGYTNDTLGTGVVTGEITALADGTALDSGKRPFKVLGLENLWGVVWENISGISHTSGVVKAYFGNDHIDKSSALSGYTEISRDDLPLCQDSGYQLKFCSYANAFFPTAVGGDSSHEVGDYYWYSSGSLKTIFLGGCWGDGSDAGLFCLFGNLGWGGSSSGVGFRLSL